MSGLIMAAQLILGLSILVLLHELGHYLAARAFGIKVEKFYLFFDAWKIKLFKFKKGDTEYGIGWLPLGGYVKIAGMIDESMDKEAMKEEPKPWEFRSKPAWQRLIVMVAGVFMNLILGVIIYTFVIYGYHKEYIPVSEVNTTGIYSYELGRELGFKTGDRIIAVDGDEVERYKDVFSVLNYFGATITIDRNGSKVEVVIPDTLYRMLKSENPKQFVEPHNFAFFVDSVIKDSPGEEAGLKKGDVFVSVNNVYTPVFGSFSEEIQRNKGKEVSLVIQRNSSLDTLMVVVDSTGKIGVGISDPPYKTKPYTLGSAINYGIVEARQILVANIKGLGKVFSGQEDARESVAGPIKIATMYGADWDWMRFWSFTGLLSLILAFMNILPIPALDGGHVVFLLIEVVSGRKIPDNVMEKIQVVGMILLLTLMALIVGNDIFGLF
ncbi:MAG: RIP metalloprotease RseP [Bacteroidales bacterium]|nr:RIP metalloprotease RseP [Bacteroidales bacterium]